MSQRLLVADSGPLIALARLGLLHLPEALYDEVLVAHAVWREVAAEPARLEHAALHTARSDGLLKLVEDPSHEPAVLAEAGLDDGERAALALALQVHCDVLIDEQRGRRVARSAGLQVPGTLGVLTRARQLGLIGAVRPRLDALVASGYHLAPALVAKVLESVGE